MCESPLIQGRASLSEAESEVGGCLGWTSNPWICLGSLPHSSQALFSPVAYGYKVQWGDFVISSQGSFKGPVPPPGINDCLLGNPDVSECEDGWEEVVTEGMGLERDQGRTVAPLNLFSQGLRPLLAGPRAVRRDQCL